MEEEDTSFKSNIMPYSYEPKVKQSNSIISSSSSESSPSDTDTEVTDDTWCNCEYCIPVAGQANICCHTYSKVMKRLKDTEWVCITQHPGFKSNCLDKYVLETSFYDYCQSDGPLGDEELIHETLRYLAYRRFVKWIFQRLGARNRKVLPCCVVTIIRKTFPADGDYTGFKESVFD